MAKRYICTAYVMPVMQQLLAHIRSTLQPLYSPDEAGELALMLMEKITGMPRVRILVNKDKAISVEQRNQIAFFVQKLREGIPVQYVLGEATFYGLTLEVDNAVLIPRPETEELVEWVERDGRPQVGLRLLDVGTGSGCIAVTLKKRLPSWHVDAVDISPEALKVATRNARRHKAEVRFLLCDVLQGFPDAGMWDVMVSNPPYIPERERKNMEERVLHHEPPVALFVPDERPLLFYEHIAALAKKHLVEGGRLYFETHYDAALAVADLLRVSGFGQVEMRRDLAGHNRMVKAVKTPGT